MNKQDKSCWMYCMRKMPNRDASAVKVYCDEICQRENNHKGFCRCTKHQKEVDFKKIRKIQNSVNTFVPPSKKLKKAAKDYKLSVENLDTNDLWNIDPEAEARFEKCLNKMYAKYVPEKIQLEPKPTVPDRYSVMFDVEKNKQRIPDYDADNYISGLNAARLLVVAAMDSCWCDDGRADSECYGCATLRDIWTSLNDMIDSRKLG